MLDHSVSNIASCTLQHLPLQLFNNQMCSLWYHIILRQSNFRLFRALISVQISDRTNVEIALYVRVDKS